MIVQIYQVYWERKEKEKTQHKITNPDFKKNPMTITQT